MSLNNNYPKRKDVMKYKFKITEDGKPEEEKEGMSFKKILKSLVEPNPKWTGSLSYENKKGRYVVHSIKEGKKYDWYR